MAERNMPNDPDWAKDSQVSKAEMWERRARRELSRARKAEDALEKAEKRIYDMEGDVTLAVGETAELAALAFAKHKWPGQPVTEMSLQLDGDEDGRKEFRVRCYVDGTGMKIDGHSVPGGFVVTAWV
jgi:hypothetical protein